MSCTVILPWVAGCPRRTLSVEQFSGHPGSITCTRNYSEGKMPAVTADTLSLPKILLPSDARDRSVRSVTTAPSGFEGEGFPVRRAFAGVDLADLDPFVHMDQMGEGDYAPYEPEGTDWHP